jgi:hypothetical protein
MSGSKVLTQDYIKENASTKEGVEYIKEYLLNARIAFGVSNLLGFLGDELKVLSRPLTEDEAHNACSVLLYCLTKIPHEQVLDYIKQCEDDAKARQTFEPKVVGTA